MDLPGPVMVPGQPGPGIPATPAGEGRRRGRSPLGAGPDRPAEDKRAGPRRGSQSPCRHRWCRPSDTGRHRRRARQGRAPATVTRLRTLTGHADGVSGMTLGLLKQADKYRGKEGRFLRQRAGRPAGTPPPGHPDSVVFSAITDGRLSTGRLRIAADWPSPRGGGPPRSIRGSPPGRRRRRPRRVLCLARRGPAAATLPWPPNMCVTECSWRSRTAHSRGEHRADLPGAAVPGSRCQQADTGAVSAVTDAPRRGPAR